MIGTVAIGVVVGGVALWLLARLWPVLLLLGLAVAVAAIAYGIFGDDARCVALVLIGGAVASALGINKT